MGLYMLWRKLKRWGLLIDVNKKYIKMTKDANYEGSSHQAKEDLITRRNGQGPEHLKFFLLVFSK